MSFIPHSRPTLGEEEKKACASVIDTLRLAQGIKVREFEEKFCQLTGRRYAVAVSSGSAALWLSLYALGVGKGDEVILPSYTCAALLHAVDFVEAKPVVADIDRDDFNISAVAVKRKINKKTKAIIVPHMFGQAARMNEILDFKMPVIEDGTQALGAQDGGNPVGSFGVLSVFSFYATKMITTGEGGMILTNSRQLADRLRDMRDYDKKTRYRFRTNSKMTDLEAAIGIEQLKKLPEFIQARRDIAEAYRGALQNSGIQLPQQSEDRDHVYFRFVVRLPQPAGKWIQDLERQGIEAKSPIYKPLHRYLKLSDRDFPETMLAMKTACSLPIFPSLDRESLSRVCDALRTALRGQVVDYYLSPKGKSSAVRHMAKVP